MKKTGFCILFILTAMVCLGDTGAPGCAGTAVGEPGQEFCRPFDAGDRSLFISPQKRWYPETWFHYIGGNVSKEGITRDLEAVADAGISGIQLFHGQFGGPWPGAPDQITSLSPRWDDAVRHTASECKRLGLRFTMLNCSGWATAGGPWIEPSNAMRHLVYSRTDVRGGGSLNERLPVPQPSEEPWRDYNDIAVLAFPTPLGDTGRPLIPRSVESDFDARREGFFSATARDAVRLSPAAENEPHWVEVDFAEPTALRSVEFPSINWFNHHQCYEPGVRVCVDAVLPDGKIKNLVTTDMPQANSQDNRPFTLACPDAEGVSKYRISITNKYPMSLAYIQLFSAARKNNWESEAGWTLRSIERSAAFPAQDEKAFVDAERIVDISSQMDDDGNLKWDAPGGNWTILRIGHVNTGRKNSPAPPEGTGWECNKLAASGAEAQFEGYIGRLVNPGGVLADGLLDGMLIDSWECYTQTWTEGMEGLFRDQTDYELRQWLPAVFGYVVSGHDRTTKFLYDWRRTISRLFTDNFYGKMTQLAHDKGLSMTYETAAGDVFPGDIMEYFKFADVPMCEFWQPMTDNFVGSANFKPVKVAASASRLYGKGRLAAEAFTSFDLTWDEHMSMLKEAANVNSADGVTHLVFHTYTHNPQEPFMPPGSSFGSGIGTPFLRGQTWWRHMPEFTRYLARCSYMLERGRPVSDVLWYLGDEINHKPDQNAPFPEGFRYDYCNPDILLNRLTVENGMIVTPEGVRYRVLWLHDSPRMLPQTLEKIYELVLSGAVVVGEAPGSIVTLSGGAEAEDRFHAAVKKLWGKGTDGVRKVGKGMVMSGMTLEQALRLSDIEPDVKADGILWQHRQTEGADWYFLCPEKGTGFNGVVDFRSAGYVEIWDPVTGAHRPVPSEKNGSRTRVRIDLARAGSCFVVFLHDKKSRSTQRLEKQQVMVDEHPLGGWNISFPQGWGAPASLGIPVLMPWKDLDIPDEGKAFSGTAVYTTKFELGSTEKDERVWLDLGRVEMIASVWVNDRKITTLWSEPYIADITEAVAAGENTVKVEVTGTWFNRLVYDAGQKENERKTWTINGPSKDAPLRESGLLGPVKVRREKHFYK